MPRYIIHDEKGERTLDLDADPVTIGRSQKCHVIIHDQKASREHCEVRKRDGGFLLVDLKSRNGTSVNGASVSEKALVAGDRIEIGIAFIRFEPVAAPAPPAAPAAPPPPPPPKPASPPKDRAYLLFTEGERKGEWFVLDVLSATIGRGKSNAVSFTDEKLSASHAEVVLDVRSGKFHVLDLRSTNGTRVNGQKTSDAELASGASIELGAQRIMFVDPRTGALPPAAVIPETVQPLPEPDTHASRRSGGIVKPALVAFFLGVLGTGGWFLWKMMHGPVASTVDLAPPAGCLIVRNHSFENGGAAGKPDVEGWHLDAHADGRVTRDAEGAPHGKHALLLHANEPGSADGVMAMEYVDPIDVERGSIYRAQAYVRTARCRGLAGLRATWLADGREVGEAFSPLLTGEEDWRLVKASFLPPRRAKQVRIACVAIGRFGEASFDEVELFREAVAPSDRPLGVRLAPWDLEADDRGVFQLTPPGDATRGEAIWDAQLTLRGEGRRAAGGQLLVDKGFPRRAGEGQEVRGRLVDLESGKSVPIAASVSTANGQATLSWVAEVPEAASAARVALEAHLRGAVSGLHLDGGAKTLAEGEASGVTRVDWAAEGSPLVWTFKPAVAVTASERDGVIQLVCTAPAKAATLTVTIESRLSAEAEQVARAEKAAVEGRPGEALAVFRELIAKAPESDEANGTARPRVIELEAQAEDELAAVGQAATGARDLADARAKLDMLAKRWPGTEWEERGRALIETAEAAMRAGASDAAARQEAEKMLASAQQALAGKKWMLAEVFGANLEGKFPGTEWAKKGADLWVQASLALARDYVKTGKKDEARKQYEGIVAKHPEHPLAAEAKRELAALK